MKHHSILMAGSMKRYLSRGRAMTTGFGTNGLQSGSASGQRLAGIFVGTIFNVVVLLFALWLVTSLLGV